MKNFVSLAAILFAPSLLVAQSTPSIPSGTFAVTHVRVFDGERTLPEQTVIVRDGKIAAVGNSASVPPEMPTVDGSGRTLLPGLIDAHVHAYATNSLDEAEALGVTTVLDMFNRPEVVKQDKAREETIAGWAGADIYSAGILATVPQGHGTEYGFDIPTLTNAAEAQSFVDARIAEGSDYLKIIIEDGSAFGRATPTLDQATIEALVAAAHARHKLAVCHIGTYAEAREAAAAGADGLMHLFVDRMPEADFGKFVADHHVFVVPTLSVLLPVASENTEGKALSDDARMTNYLPNDDIANLGRSFGVTKVLHLSYEATTESIRQLKAAHVTILAGTDAPNPGTMFGASLHGELELLVKAGLTPEEALRAATSKPAACFSLGDRGQIAAGKRADLLLVAGDPTVNITDTRNIVAVWKAGHADDRAAYAAALAAEKRAASTNTAAPGLGDGSISSFEDGEVHSAFGAGWAKSTDSLYGGKSKMDYEVAAGGADGTKKALHVTGEIIAGFAFPWAGAMFSPGAGMFAPANLSKFSGVQFWAKGDGKTYRIMYFTAAGGGTPQSLTFVAGPEWKHYSFPFASFAGSDGHDVLAILFSGGPEAGKFDFQIDEIRLVPQP